MNRSAPLLLALATGCLPQVGPPVDAGGTGGEGGGGGAAAVSCSDALRDGTESDVDCGGDCAPCALGAACATALDCTSGLCTSGQCARPASPCGAFAGCTPLAFVDLRDAGTATIAFPVGGSRYSPACARVRFGQSVTFSGGDFSSHPLAQACGPVSGVLGASSGQSTTITFDRALGVFGFYCDRHGSPSGSGMSGAIEVVR